LESEGGGVSAKPFGKKEYKQILADMPEEFQPNLVLSIFWFLFDLSVILFLGGVYIWLDNLYYAPIYWLLQGSALWAMFMIGHDCGHGSFAKKKWINKLFGEISHGIIAIPFTPWAISHKKHHEYNGNVQKDESWVPYTLDHYKYLGDFSRKSLFHKVFFLSIFISKKLWLFVMPIYLTFNSAHYWCRGEFFKGTHFSTKSVLFKKEDYRDVIISIATYVTFIAFCFWAIYQFGFISFISIYFIPLTIAHALLAGVTYLHHTDVKTPYYYDEDWDKYSAGFSTVDRDYGFIFNVWWHHITDCHVFHHLYYHIPHYRLKAGTAYLKASPLFPEHLYMFHEDTGALKTFRNFFHTRDNCLFVEKDPDNKIVYYKNDRERIMAVMKPVPEGKSDNQNDLKKAS